MPESPTQFSNLSRSNVWSTVSNAALRSSNISIEVLPECVKTDVVYNFNKGGLSAVQGSKSWLEGVIATSCCQEVIKLLEENFLNDFTYEG